MTWTDEDEKTLMELQFRRQEISSAQDAVWKKHGLQPQHDLLSASDIAGLCADLAQFDPSEEQRTAAVAKLTELGYRWVDGAWVCLAAPAGSLPPVEPVWTPWSGGECPVEPGTYVDVKHRDSTVRSCVNAAHLRWHYDSAFPHWDILAFRLYSPH